MPESKKILDGTVDYIISFVTSVAGLIFAGKENGKHITF